MQMDPQSAGAHGPNMHGENELHFRRLEPSSWLSPYLWPERGKLPLGDTDNLALSVTTDEGMDEAKTALYMGLIEKGWEHAEIAGERRAGGGIAGGNLRVFSGAGAGMFMR